MVEIKSIGAILVLVMTLFFGFILFAFSGQSWMSDGQALRFIKIGGVPLYVDVADTPEKFKVGLTDKKFLAQDHGLLFILKRPALWRVTTEGMAFPIDIFWIDDKKRVVTIVKHADKDDTPNIYEPSLPAKYILETNADFAEIYNIQLGDRLRLK